MTIPESVREEIKTAVLGGMGQRKAGREFGVTHSTVKRIVRGYKSLLPKIDVRPHRVEWFDCPECHVASNLKWDAADRPCFACHIRETVRLEGLARGDPLAQK